MIYHSPIFYAKSTNIINKFKPVKSGGINKRGNLMKRMAATQHIPYNPEAYLVVIN